MPPTVVLAGSLDTKGAEYEFVRQRFIEGGVDVTLVDTSVLGGPAVRADISREEVARAAGAVHADLVAQHDRGAALLTMSKGLTEVVSRLLAEGRLDGAFALGGTGGTATASAAFRALPVGVPKIIVSTAASGHTEQYIGETDLILVPSIVDIAGLNRISSTILANAAGAMIGMLTQGENAKPAPHDSNRPLVAASMFGVTTPAIDRARVRLQELGYEPVVFHMTGSGGRAMEALIRQGYFAGVLDVTTTELADNLVGGVFDAGDQRLTAAAETRTPQVVSVGALDMVNFGPRHTVPAEFRERTLYQHNSSVTLMRTTPEEMAELGTRLARKAREAAGPTVVYLPLRGVSAIDVDGEPFHDPEADRRLFESIRSGLAGTGVRLEERETDVNDPDFADAMVDALHELIVESHSTPE
jgi:uncharacterized protein (UPF0261 family)